MRKVLIVDDEEEVASLVEQVLTAHGYEAVVCLDGAEAWSRLRAEGADLAVLDVKMPRMDGLELCRRIRADKRLRALPVLMLTGLRTTGEQVDGYETGADDYLRKPFHIDVLLARLQALERRLL